METPLYYQSLRELSDALQQGKITAESLMQSLLKRIDQTESRVQSFISLDREDALRQARASDERRQQHQELSPFDGIPIAIKDLISVKNQPLTCASKMLGNYISPYDATVIERLKSKGFVIFGRLNLDEFAMGSSTENSAFHVTHNPWNLECVPGGSSGGSASSLAAGQAIVTLGTDTGGSIRQPAAFCGVSGLKPTYGRVSRFGACAFASSLDQIGPMGRSIDDIATVLSVIAGHDEHDSTSVTLPVEDYYKLAQERGPWTIGVPREFFAEGLDKEIQKSLEAAIEFYKKQGCTIKEISLPHAKFGIAVYYIVAVAEAFSNLARFDGIRYGHRTEKATSTIELYCKSRAEGFGQEVKRRMILGAFVLSGGYQDAYYTRAQKVRTLIRRDYEAAFRDVDVILCPTTPTPAFPLGGKTEDPLAMYLNDICTVSANLAGVPALSIPCGFTTSGLPIGMQLIGNLFEEGKLLAVGNAFQKAHDYHLRQPKL